MKPLTKKQLYEFFQDYRKAFSDWAVEHTTVLYRNDGPVKQIIAFQPLRSGAYRSSCSIELLLKVPDGCRILYQLLSKHSDIFPRQHSILWSQVLKEMEEQFIPPVRKPLNAFETLEYAEAVMQNSVDNIGINNSTGMAALNAYFNHRDRALYWCDQVNREVASVERQLVEWEINKRQFIDELRQAIVAGRAKEFIGDPLKE